MKRLSHSKKISRKTKSKSHSKKSCSSNTKRRVSKKSLNKLSGGSKKRSSKKSVKRSSNKSFLKRSSPFLISKHLLSRTKSSGFAAFLTLQKKMREDLSKQSDPKYKIRGGPVFTTLVKTYNAMAKQNLPGGKAEQVAEEAYNIFKNDNIKKRIDDIIAKGVTRKPRKSKKSKSVSSEESSD